MGYTHHWTLDLRSERPADTFPALLLQAQLIVQTAARSGIALEFPEGPFVHGGAIVFDGVEPFWADTFAFSARPDRHTWGWDPALQAPSPSYHHDWCKTNEHPYDAPVCAVLIRAKVLWGPALTVSSDGAWDRGWLRGRRLYTAAFNEDAPNPLTTD